MSIEEQTIEERVWNTETSIVEMRVWATGARFVYENSAGEVKQGLLQLLTDGHERCWSIADGDLDRSVITNKTWKCLWKLNDQVRAVT